jgi:molybdopterin-containing oxidoreductase family iron-sulfur binding subunit
VQIRARRSADGYWKTVEEARGTARASTGEFPGGLPRTRAAEALPDRRDFLSLLGFSLGAAGAASCRAPVQHAVPLPVASNELVPGAANWYATTCGGCPASCALLVKQRDGRPIKIEGNADSELFGGGTCATGQAAVLSLYDEERLRGPLWKGRPVTWKEIDGHVTSVLDGLRGDPRRVVVLSGTITSPSLRALISRFGGRFRDFHHVVYDAVSSSALRAANASSFGRPVVPHFSFDKARVIVGLEADFLGTWLSPVEFAHQYMQARRRGGTRPRHFQFESGLSVTGSNADRRFPVAPSQLGKVALALLRRIAARAGVTSADAPGGADEPVDPRQLDAVADALWEHRGASLVVSGANDRATDVLVAALNAHLGNVGRTLDLGRPSWQRQGDDAAMAELVEAMNRGQVSALILHGVNPAYDYSSAVQLLQGLKKVELSVSFSDRRDETSAHVHAVCPDHHFLESWGDAEPVASELSLTQPLIAPLHDTRAAAESLLGWMGDSQDHYRYLRGYWEREIFPRQSTVGTFQAFWDGALQRGVTRLPRAGAGKEVPVPDFTGDWQAAAREIGAVARPVEGTYELHLYESVPLRDGRHANNPWLQELPDPITKLTWGNAAAVAPATAARLGLANGDVVSLRAEGATIELPVFVQPGQDPRTISVALGHGRRAVGKAGSGVGTNAFGAATIVQGARRYFAPEVRLTKTGRREALAGTQAHFSMEGRPIVLETEAGQPAHVEHAQHAQHAAHPSIWAERKRGDHAWGMAIDLDSCTGCSACVVSCQAENNVPVVGKDQVIRNRIMHWIRIDRYYRGPEENPATVHQPMMCQHCQHAPCETVCPVLATSNSSEGLNQQVYNRCIGTRYCANNCPYKVRRFNWHNYTDNTAFDFNMASPLGRLVLNPDVTVRSRGVMEKCSLCVQRIQLGKNQALREGRAVAEGDVKTACQQSCPTQAIVFGDLDDPESRVSRLLADGRAYRVLDELGTKPNVGYLKRIRSERET